MTESLKKADLCSIENCSDRAELRNRLGYKVSGLKKLDAELAPGVRRIPRLHRQSLQQVTIFCVDHQL
jgi:hypothetical protein